MKHGLENGALILGFFIFLILVAVAYDQGKKLIMRTKSNQKLYRITVLYPNGLTRTVNVKAGTREVAEHRAMKRCPGASKVQRSQ